MVDLIGGNLIPFSMVVLTFLLFVFWICAATVDSVYKTSCNTRLKEKLIARGDGPEDIERILDCGQATADSTTEPNRTFPPRKQAAAAGWPSLSREILVAIHGKKAYVSSNA